MKYICLFLFILYPFTNLADTPKIRTGFLYINEGMSLENALYYQARLPKKLIKSKGFISKVLKYNPQLSLQKDVTIGDVVYLEIPYQTTLVAFNKKDQKQKRKVANISKSTVKLQDNNQFEFDPRHSLGSFFTTSYGSFTEKFGESVAKTEQNSPYTFGLSYGFTQDEHYSYSASLYVSNLVATSFEGTSETTDIPYEYGLTGYVNLHDYKLANWVPYGGLDFESFSTFNLDERDLGEELDTREHQFLYITAGVSNLISVFNKKIFIKTSLSQSIYSQSSRNSLVDGDTFSGVKGIFFAATSINNKWSAHFLLKQHLMEGPTDLSVTRYGVGLGYKLF